jgi:hypothetical protein
MSDYERIRHGNKEIYSAVQAYLCIFGSRQTLVRTTSRYHFQCITADEEYLKTNTNTAIGKSKDSKLQTIEDR